MKILQEVYAKVGILTIILTVALATNYLFAAWSTPPADPPNSNVDAPVNIGTTDQDKQAALGVDGLAVFGGALIQDGTQATGSVLMSQDGFGTAAWVATSSLGVGGGGSTEVNFSSVYNVTGGTQSLAIGPSGDWDACYLTQASAYGGTADNEDEDFDCAVFDDGSQWLLDLRRASFDITVQCSAQCMKVTTTAGGGGGGGTSLPDCADDDFLNYNASQGEWECYAGSIGGSGITEVDTFVITSSYGALEEVVGTWSYCALSQYKTTEDDNNNYDNCYVTGALDSDWTLGLTKHSEDSLTCAATCFR